jgi:hypothetical protein
MPITSWIAGGAVQDFIYQRQQGCVAFEGEALGAQVALLHYLLEDVRANQQFQNVLLVHGHGLRFHAFLDPPPAFDLCDVHELDAHRSAVDIACLAGEFTVGLQLWNRLWT